MDAFFIKLLNTSISASWLVLAVLVLRTLLKKSPRWIHVALWALVAVRLLCPISFESALSLVPSGETIPQTIVYAQIPAIDSGVPAIDRVVNDAMAGSLTPMPGASVNPIQIHLFLQEQIWCLGFLAMLVWAAVSYFRLRRRVAAAMVLEQGVHICDYIDTPFILGIFKPVIYLPSAMDTNSISHVLAHERAHIARKDHWWKPLGYLMLSIHWFNPIMWLAYILLCRDIELACDERVIQNMAGEQKKAYSEALLHCSVSRRSIAACPLAFGEVGVKERVKTVLRYRKPAFWVVLVAVMALFLTAVCFLTDPSEKIDDKTAQWFEEYAYEQVKDRMDREDVTCVAGNADYALVYYRGGEPSLTLYRYEKKGGQIEILEGCSGECADEAGMSLNHLESNGKHIYFGTISEYHWNSAVETTTWINWDYLTFTDARGQEYKQDMTGREGFLFLLDAPAVDFQAVDGLGTVCLDMEKYRDQGYSMKETEFRPLGYQTDVVSQSWKIGSALEEYLASLDRKNKSFWHQLPVGSAIGKDREQVRLIHYDAGGPELSTEKLDCFEYQVTEEGIRFKPKDREGWVLLQYREEPYADCGLGLVTEAVSYKNGKYTGIQGFYDGSAIWSFQSLITTAGDVAYEFVLINESAAEWVTEFSREIVDTIRTVGFQITD